MQRRHWTQFVVVARTESRNAVESDAQAHHLVLVVGESQDSVGVEDVADDFMVESRNKRIAAAVEIFKLEMGIAVVVQVVGGA